jgi:branched-chain amino acid transport system ATP-binding protein
MTLLSLKNLTKRFGGLIAVSDVSFDVKEGIIAGLIGPNGAGKTTIFDLITGNYKTDGGDVFFAGGRITNQATHKIVEQGVARTFQTIRLFQKLTVIENVLAGCHCRMNSGIIPAMLRLSKQKEEEEQALIIALRELEFVGLADQIEQVASNLAYGSQRLLEIARALATKPRFIILDEPAGGMNDQETMALISLIGKIKERGVTVLLIEHDMGVVMESCEHIVVLEYGIKIAEGPPDVIKGDPKVIEAYLGTEED